MPSHTSTHRKKKGKKSSKRENLKGSVIIAIKGK